MDDATRALPLPPGRGGLPLVGETLAMLKDPYRFLAERKARHGAVFRSRILGRDVVFLSGPAGAAAFLDTDNVTRERGHPAQVRDLFGGVNINMFDGPTHKALKGILLEAFTPRALAGYLPAQQALVEAALERWTSGGEIGWQDELRRLAIEAIGQDMLGIAPGPESAAMARDYVELTPGFLAIPLRLPGTTFQRALKARVRLFERFRRIIAEHRAAPRSDGLSIVLAARAADGRAITDDELVLELHHMIVAGYIIFGLFAELALRLHQDAALRARLEAEVAEVSPSGPITPAQLARLPLLTGTVNEAKRTAPILPLVFATARRTFAHGGYRIPEGWGVFFGLPLSNSDPEVFTDPARFDPSRFAEPRREDARVEHAFIPQGAGPPTGHRCLGLEYSTVLSQVFLVSLLRGHAWELPAQDLGYRYNLVPAELTSGLRARIRRR